MSHFFGPNLTPFCLCHKLSHMADPSIKNMSQATPLRRILLTFAPEFL